MRKGEYQIENILDKDKTEGDEESKYEEISACESELFCRQSNTREVLEGFFD